jgi:hypothetical protein
MKKAILAFLLLIVLGITTAQTPNTIMEKIEAQVQQLLGNAGLVPTTQGGIAERIDGGLGQLILAAKPPPPSDITCVVNVDCAPAIQKALAAAPDGGTVTLPAGQHLVASPIRINGPLHLRGAGRTQTVLVHKQNINYAGSAGIVFIGRDDKTALRGVTVSDFTLKADRIANPALRTTAMRVRYGTSDLVIRDMHFEGCTSNCIAIGGWHMSNIKILNNTANEYYEQFVEISLQHSTDILVAGNIAKSTKGHPALGPTEPFCFMLTPGHSGSGNGIVDKVWFVNNVCDHRGIGIGEITNSGGVQISQDQASAGYQFGFGRMYVTGNKFYDMGRAVRLQMWRTSSTVPVSPGGGYLAIEGNEMSNIINEPISIENSPAGATANDFVFIGKNEIRARGYTPFYKVIGPTTVVKYRNICTNIASSVQVCN